MGCGVSSARKDTSFASVGPSSSRSYAGLSFSSNNTYKRSYPTERNRNFPDGDANKGALKKQLKQQMMAAMKKGDLQKLEEALKRCERHAVTPDEDYYKAIRKVEYLRIKQGLREAVRRRHVGTLEKALRLARASPFALQLASAITAADKLHSHLMQLPVHRHSILEMEPATVSEIRSFKSPPLCVVTVMAAVHRLLGYKKREVVFWTQIKTLMAQTYTNSLLYRIKTFDPSTPSLNTLEDVSTMLKSVSYDEVLMASNGAARFYIWASNTLENVTQELSKGSRKRKKGN
ncbi:uncharacterized protein LOC112554166 isoform X1 [Pomacea canaliculata]|uniref:uncharacterized protein LOC112554166 isoform X1 n=1 Tax=Pomacea canaliculata TaxID=400727 RepID=UPI000D73E3B5|nr:uncharacterized protein LOC112554166 isoform X1 [Pomacea canaliculata]